MGLGSFAMRAIPVVLVGAGTSASALAATAPLQAPARNGAMKAITAVVGFQLPREFVPSRSVSRGAGLRGVYERRVRVSGQTCLILVRALGRLERRKPTLDHAAAPWGLRPKFTLARRGRVGPLHWYAGRAEALPTALAWRKLSGRLARRNPYLAVYMQVDQQQHGTQACLRAIAQQRTHLRHAIRSAHVRRR
jgi:hypothetical protein